MFRERHFRGRMEITADIVRLCLEGTRKTAVMYKCNLSYEQLNRYLKEVQERGLIEKDVINGKGFYKATPKGRDYLAKYDRLQQIIKDDQYLPTSHLSTIF